MLDYLESPSILMLHTRMLALLVVNFVAKIVTGMGIANSHLFFCVNVNIAAKLLIIGK